jgi:hypothetical protein
MMDRSPPLCDRCGAVLSPALAGMCPRCWLRAGLKEAEAASSAEEPTRGEHEQPRRFGDYELMEKLARGGMGVVYKARHISLNRTVALKMIPEGMPEPHALEHRFRAERIVTASLDHPNIIPIYEAGEHEGHHYFTMKLMEGGSLDKQKPHFLGRPRKVALLLEVVARAVHYGHQRGVLHRDLKPANLLLDAEGAPHVADFGVAKVLNTEAGGTQLGAVVGTLGSSVVGTVGYMAPEQAEPRGQPLSVAADIYSLGVILYELVTGQLPFRGDSSEKMPEPAREASSLARSTTAPRIPRALEAICHKCLKKDPAQRYGSAAELAEDLRRYLRGERIGPPPQGLLSRAWSWCRTHPLGAGLLATLLWSLGVAAVGAVNIARAQEEDLRNEALRSNLYAARLMAGAVLFELAQYSQSVERAAAEPALVAALQQRDAAAMEAFCKDRFAYYDGPPGGLRSTGACFILDTAGFGLANWPPQPQTVVGKNYEWRDYFQGARRLSERGQRTAYVSRVIRSEGDDRYAFALSAPVYAVDGRWLGVLMTLVASGSTLGSLRLNDESDSSRTATLVAPTDRARGQPTLPAADVYTVIVHEGLGRGMPVLLDRQTARRLARAFAESLPPGREQFHIPTFGGMTLEGYRDPVSNEPGQWLAAFAPIGHTGFAVIVQTREKAALAVNAQLARRIAWWGLPFVIGIALVWLFFGWFRYYSREALTE